MDTDWRSKLFPGFERFQVATEGASIHGVKGGEGPPLLLLHGWPQNHLEWARIAPALAQRFTVVAMDLRGYGDSSKPADDAAHASYSKREMARDCVSVMRHFGFEKFAVVGHDRGGRVGHRLALDHPERVSSLTVIDIVPTLKLYSEVTKAFASTYFHWFLLIQPAPVPETLLGNSAEFLLRVLLGGYVPKAISQEVFADYLRCFSDPATRHAMCEDYRAAASIDLEHDRSDLGEKVRCPVLVLWGEYAAMHPLYDVLATWRERASDVRGKALPGGHWLPEELPEQVLAELRAFLG
jgi:haloacetate dehalogenase